MKKRLFACCTALALLLCMLPVTALAAQISVPSQSKVMVVYDYLAETTDVPIDSLYRSEKTEVIREVIAALNALQGASVVQNVSNIKPADRIVELRTGNGDMMRYFIYSKVLNRNHSYQIISQRIENGYTYQGMSFTGGNVPTVIANLSKALDNTDRFSMPFSLTEKDIDRMYMFRYGDQTYTEIAQGNHLQYAVNLLRASTNMPYDNRPTSAADRDYGKALSDLSDLTLLLRDGTRVTCSLYERGIQVQQTNYNVNAVETKMYKADAVVYPQLLAHLRKNQSYSRPAWLGSMNPDKIKSITVTNAAGTNFKTYKQSDKEFSSIIEELLSVNVQTNSLQKLPKRSKLANASNVRMEFTTGVIYTLDFAPSQLEIESSDMGYVASYRLLNSGSGSWFLESLLK